ncbi:hypothetical protein QJ857_gp0735 [Tupanvirus soda lake]|uniref:RNA ligase domain-containing protein n=2 Tax=Tupanvirus TaxID=2094720 RepID=A0A6N1NVE0_9VIRU|nr:hypothetical protein QJ857_gp0735 [Tupanvirus soda lake]QKU35313.1 hypothetical protein [Tupanvirus soda lake]
MSDTANIKFYPSIEHFEPANLKPNGSVCYIEEKIDGSQMAFLIHGGEIAFINKKKFLKGQSATYEKALTTLPIIKDKLNPDLIYYGEYVKSLKANVVVYHRVPKFFFILYDIYSMSQKKWYNYNEKKLEAERVGLDCVPLLYCGDGSTQPLYEVCTDIINQIESGQLQSCLGGTPEGIVVKRDGAKFKMVTNAFKERHAVKQEKCIWMLSDYLKYIGEQFNVEPRFQKAYQHLVEDETPVTPENLCFELDADLYKEYESHINSYINAQYLEYIRRGFTNSKEALKTHPDPIAQEIIELARKIKLESTSPAENSNKESFYKNLENDILDMLCTKFKPTICQHARSDLIKWYNGKQFGQ